MADKGDDAIKIITNLLAEHKECNKEITELKDQLRHLTDSKNKREMELEKKIEAIAHVTQQKTESEYKRKMKDTEKIYIKNARTLIQTSIEIKEENEQLKTRLKVRHNETMQIAILEQHNNLLTERIALIEKRMDETERDILDDCVASLKNENKILEDRITSPA